MKKKYVVGKQNSRKRANRPATVQQRAYVAKHPPIPVTQKVSYQQARSQFKWGTWPLTPGMVALVSAIGVGAVGVGLIGSRNGAANVALPCPVPTNAAVNTSNNPIACTTNSGLHYVWISNSGGWVPSEDGVHPNAGAHGVGEGDDSGGAGHAGVGGDGHGGGDGG